MNGLMLILKVGGLKKAKILQESLWSIGTNGNQRVFLDTKDNFSFELKELELAIVSAKFDYWDGIVIGSFGGSSRLILSNAHGHLGCYWGYQSFRPTREIRSADDLNALKSDAINNGAKMDWSTFQWVLNNLEVLTEPVVDA